MANRKLMFWSRFTRRPVCQYCGELWGTTTATWPDGFTYRSCVPCAAWIADDTDNEALYRVALAVEMDALPWLLRRRPSVRELNCSAASYREAAHDPQKRADAYDQLTAEYSAALWPARFAYDAGQIIGQWWEKARFNAGIAADGVRLLASRPGCAHCGVRATAIQRLRDDTAERTPVCDDCCYAINDGTQLPPGGAG